MATATPATTTAPTESTMRNELDLARFVPSRDDAAVIGFVLLLYCEHLIFGANRGDLALFFAIVHLVLLIAVLATKTGRRVLASTPLAWVGASFALVLIGAVFSILPLGGRIGHPIWNYVSSQGGSISLDPVATRLEIVKLLGLAALFAVAIVIGAKRERADTFIKALSYVGGAYAAWAFLNWTANPNLIFGVVRPYGNGRLSASFLSANSAATLFACQSILQLCLAFRAVRRAPRPLFSRRAWSQMQGLPLALVLLFINVSCLLLTASRAGSLTAVAATAVVVAGFIIVRTDERSASAGLAAVCGVIVFEVAALVLANGQSLLGRLADNPVSDSRVVIFAAYWRSILASPWWGYGLGAFHAFNFQSMNEANAIPLGILGAAHNVYLQWLLQSGVAGFFPMMICMGTILAIIWSGFKRRSRQTAILIFTLAVASIFAVHELTDYALEEPSLAAFFAVILGLGYGVSTRA